MGHIIEIKKSKSFNFKQLVEAPNETGTFRHNQTKRNSSIKINKNKIVMN